jgi:hypothetical protein
VQDRYEISAKYLQETNRWLQIGDVSSLFNMWRKLPHVGFLQSARASLEVADVNTGLKQTHQNPSVSGNILLPVTVKERTIAAFPQNHYIGQGSISCHPWVSK